MQYNLDNRSQSPDINQSPHNYHKDKNGNEIIKSSIKPATDFINTCAAAAASGNNNLKNHRMGMRSSTKNKIANWERRQSKDNAIEDRMGVGSRIGGSVKGPTRVGGRNIAIFGWF